MNSSEDRTMKRIDGFLSRKAQAHWPGALVYCEDLGNGETWTLERAGLDTIGLGSNFGHAQQALWALIAAEKERNSKK